MLVIQNFCEPCQLWLVRRISKVKDMVLTYAAVWKRIEGCQLLRRLCKDDAREYGGTSDERFHDEDGALEIADANLMSVNC